MARRKGEHKVSEGRNQARKEFLQAGAVLRGRLRIGDVITSADVKRLTAAGEKLKKHGEEPGSWWDLKELQKWVARQEKLSEVERKADAFDLARSYALASAYSSDFQFFKPTNCDPCRKVEVYGNRTFESRFKQSLHHNHPQSNPPTSPSNKYGQLQDHSAPPFRQFGDLFVGFDSWIVADYTGGYTQVWGWYSTEIPIPGNGDYTICVKSSGISGANIQETGNAAGNFKSRFQLQVQAPPALWFVWARTAKFWEVSVAAGDSPYNQWKWLEANTAVEKTLTLGVNTRRLGDVNVKVIESFFYEIELIGDSFELESSIAGTLRPLQWEFVPGWN